MRSANFVEASEHVSDKQEQTQTKSSGVRRLSFKSCPALDFPHPSNQTTNLLHTCGRAFKVNALFQRFAEHSVA